MSDWRPIAGVPKDGTRVDLWCTHPRTRASQRFTDIVWSTTDKQWWMLARCDWLSHQHHGYEPTHWMPTPNPPDSIKEPSE